MKKSIFIFVTILLSCGNQQEKLKQSVSVNYVSKGDKYGKLYKNFNVIMTIIKYDDYNILIYKDSTNYKRIDTLKIFNDGKVIFNNIKAENVYSKSIMNNNKLLFLQKIYIPHNKNITVDDFSGEIIYLNKDGIIARYGITSDYISFYNPDLYPQLHNKILYRTLNFKRHPDELEGMP